jgi:hypothetical protein
VSKEEALKTLHKEEFFLAEVDGAVLFEENSERKVVEEIREDLEELFL